MYNRLFTKILDSSIWLEPTTTRIVWITLLAAMDKDGYAHFSAVENLSSRARIPLEETEKAIEVLSAPDPNSGNPEHEGRRIERVPGGFIILNAQAHHGLMNKEVEREQTRIRVANHRAKKKGNVTSVTQMLPSVTPVSVSVVTSGSTGIGDARGKGRPTKEEVVAYSSSLGLTDGEYFFDHWLANGWTNGGKPIRDWKATIRSWKGAGHCPSQRPPPSNGAKPWVNAKEARQAENDAADRAYRLKKLRKQEALMHPRPPAT